MHQNKNYGLKLKIQDALGPKTKNKNELFN